MRMNKQRGSMLFWASYALLIGLLVVEVFNLAPAYYNHYKVKGLLEGLPGKIEKILKNNRALGSGLPFKDEVKRSLTIDFRISGIDNVPLDNLKYVKIAEDKVKVSLAYEARNPLFWNISTVITFSDEVVVPYQ